MSEQHVQHRWGRSEIRPEFLLKTWKEGTRWKIDITYNIKVDLKACGEVNWVQLGQDCV